MKFIPISYCTHRSHGCDGRNRSDGYGSHGRNRSHGCNGSHGSDGSDWPYGCNGCGGYSGFECIFHACGGCGKRRCA